MRHIRRIAIANRGEAATRCLRAIRELRIEEGTDLVGIALYSEEDRLAPFVRQADEAYALGPARRVSRTGESKLAYLDVDYVLETLERVAADTLWPGWGFLSESPEFVERLRERGITFLGPSAETMRRLGDKIESKRIAAAAGVPVVPWSEGPISRDALAGFAARIRLPVVLKATAGGGGRGIRIVEREADLVAAFESAAAEAHSAFGDGTLFMEGRVAGARHIEVQMAGDEHGRVLALGLRDCSVQRKHQKLIEEGPPAGLSEELSRAMCQASVRLLEHVGYVGVATCEYLVSDAGEFYFLEVNPRLQVEHGVTELVTGMDLVKTQIRIARGEALPHEPPAVRGAAIEVRLCAEDPARSFAPSPGRIALLDLPEGPGIRVDAGVASGTSIPAEYDSMIAKVLAHGATRAEARARLTRALLETRLVVEGGMTNKGFLLDVLGHPDFEAARIKTQWLDTFKVAAEPTPVLDALIVAAIHAYQEDRAGLRTQFFSEAARGRPLTTPPSAGVGIDLAYAGVLYRLRVFALGGWTYRIHAGDRVRQVTLLEQGPHSRALITRDRRVQVLVSGSPVEIQVELAGHVHRIQRDTGGRVRASSPCLLIELTVKAGDRVEVGDRLGLFEAMKCETSFHASVPGVVREVLAHPGDRRRAGDVILVIEPSGDMPPQSRDQTLLFTSERDPLELFSGPDQSVALERAASAPAAERAAALEALGGEVRRILMGYDINEERAAQLMALLDSPLGQPSPALRTELSHLLRHLSLFTNLEVIFTRTAPRVQGEDFSPSNDAWMVLYLRRIAAKGAGIEPVFLERLLTALRHYGIDSLEPSERLHRAVLRLYSTRTTSGLRNRLVTALLNLAIRLADTADEFEGAEQLREPLDHLWQLRGTVSETVADLAAQARFMLFDRKSSAVAESNRPEELSLTQLPVPPGTDLSPYGARLGLTEEDAARFELWRLANFDLERIAVPSFLGVIALFGRAKGSSGDHRFFCFADVSNLGPDTPQNPDLSLFERRFHATVEAMRWAQAHHAGARRLHWNRLTLFVRTPVALSERSVALTLKRLAPETRHLGLERVLVRVALCEAGAAARDCRATDLIAGNPSGGRVEWNFRTPHSRPLEPASPYERRVALARSRGLTYPYEIVRLFTSAPESRATGAEATGPGRFVEYDLYKNRAEPVERAPGSNSCGIVFGVIATPTAKHPEGMRRVLILSDPTFDMGALAAAECDRIVAAIDLAQRERVPVEWVAVSAGARIAMDSGTENLDATARVVRRIVTFTDAGGEINVIVAGVNVGAQSYFDALATMGLGTRGVLIMLPGASMVLTGRAALEAAGGVSAEDELGIGGYERIMGPSGQAHYLAHDLSHAWSLLLEHYAVSYVAPGEAAPRQRVTQDPHDRDVTLAPYDGRDGYSTIGDVFSSETNPGRKRPFCMRPVMRSIADADSSVLERWRDFRDARSAIVWDCHIGGVPITLIGMESHQVPRHGDTPNDGPAAWTAATLFPGSSKKVARALNAASGNRPAVILANLAGFDGSPESMRRGILEMGSEIARAVVHFSGRLAFVVVTRYHGGAYVVFSRELNDELRVAALTGSYASVIGGAAAAAVIFNRDVQKRASSDARVTEVSREIARAGDAATRAALRARYARVYNEVVSEKQQQVAQEFDSVHTVERAQRVGSLECIVEPRAIRPTLIGWLTQ